MSVTITVTDGLADQLAGRAKAQNVSVQDLAIRILDQAVAGSDGDQQWRSLNTRRVALIKKSFRVPLSPEEMQELQQLQATADKRVDHLDDKVLCDLRQLQCEVARLGQDSQR